jgi:hypothetical protein
MIGKSLLACQVITIEQEDISWIPAAAIPRLLAVIAKSADPGDEPEDQVEDGVCSAPRRPPAWTPSR